MYGAECGPEVNLFTEQNCNYFTEILVVDAMSSINLCFIESKSYMKKTYFWIGINFVALRLVLNLLRYEDIYKYRVCGYKKI